LHWSAGHYGQPHGSYHYNIDQDGTVYTGVESLTERLPHTWEQNSGSVGVSMLCCAFASPDDLGDPARVEQYGEEYLNDNEIPYEPPTDAQIEAMAQVVAVLCQELAVPMEYVKTHAEQALIDGYGPGSGDPQTRWDLWVLPGVIKGQGGNAIRGKAVYYMGAGV
jgi:N-acetyl-anhydromuramyl-L-alanine amidase AmpD